jgi:outer membrane scaffolding protein for murein synthesis (MipA/OmpV family)
MKITRMKNNTLKNKRAAKNFTDSNNKNGCLAILRCILLVVFMALVLNFSGPSFCQEASESILPSPTKPLWELGLFNGVARLPLYRGSATYRTYALPLPYLIYRGDIFQSDREGIRGIFFRSEFLESSLSVFGNPPVNDNDNAREGMGDLDPILEIGPALKWYFLGHVPRRYLYLSPAFRWVTSVGLPDNLKFSYQGWRFLINLIYQNDAIWGNDRWGWGFNVGIDFADHRYNGYFYDVPEKDALPGRPAFDADGGYGGLMVSGNLIYRMNHQLSVAVYGRWDALAGAIYRDSPLVEENNNFTTAAALIWTIATSKKKVDARYQER